MVVTQNGAKPKESTPPLLKKTFATAVILYAVLIGLTFVPFVGALVFIFAFIVAYLWVYIGFLVACVTFVAAWLLARRILANAKQRLQFALLGGMIAFAVVGIALMASVVCFRYNTHLIGFWLHTRICLDADKARRWAQNVEFVETEYGPERRNWRMPIALQLTGLPAGDVNVDPQTRNVTIEQGSPLSGHWGVWVTAKGRQWDSAPSRLKDAYHLKVEDGVWVWDTED